MGSAAPSARSSPGPAPFPLPPHLRSRPPSFPLPRLTAVHLEALMPGSEPVDLALLIGQEPLQLPLHRLGQLRELGPLQDLLQHSRHLGSNRCAFRPNRHRPRRAQGFGRRIAACACKWAAPRGIMGSVVFQARSGAPLSTSVSGKAILSAMLSEARVAG